MAACGGIEHIFEKPLPEPQNFLEAALSPWKHIKALKNPNSNVDDSSFTEIFGELHFKESHLHDQNNNNNNNSNPAPAAREIQAADQDREKGGNGNYSPSSGQRRQQKQYKHSQSFSSDSLSLCTEGLGFESCDEVEETTSHDEFPSREWHHGDGDVVRNPSQRGEAPRGRSGAGTGEFPPPISCIGRSGKPWVCFKSYREDGRFILKEVRIPTQEFLHACRGDGRLQLHFVQSDDDEEQNRIEAEVVDVDEEEHNQELA